MTGSRLVDRGVGHRHPGQRRQRHLRLHRRRMCARVRPWSRPTSMPASTAPTPPPTRSPPRPSPSETASTMPTHHRNHRPVSARRPWQAGLHTRRAGGRPPARRRRTDGGLRRRGQRRPARPGGRGRHRHRDHLRQLGDGIAALGGGPGQRRRHHQFPFSLACPVITLAQTLVISTNLTIDGPGAGTLAVSGGNLVQVLSVPAGTTVAISGLTIEDGATAAGSTGPTGASTGSGQGGTGGNGANGGGVMNAGTLTLTTTRCRATAPVTVATAVSVDPTGPLPTRAAAVGTVAPAPASTTPARAC